MDFVENGTDNEEYEQLHKIVLGGMINYTSQIVFLVQLVILMLTIRTLVVNIMLVKLRNHILSK